MREFLDGKLRAEIAASDHHCIGDLNDGGQILNCSASFSIAIKLVKIQ